MKQRGIKRENFIWLDLEMTGLIPEKDKILEIATIITNDNLEIIAEGPDLVIHESPETLQAMDSFVYNLHQKHGLITAVEQSIITLREAEDLTLEFLQHHFKKEHGILCGNSVWNDKQFIRLHMPRLHEFLYYRIVDVSSIKELIKRWYPQSPYTDFKKQEKHRALDDVKESIAELRHYRQHFFIPQELTQRSETQEV